MTDVNHLVCATDNGSGDDATGQNASDHAQPWPSRVAAKPEAGNTNIVRDCALVCVLEGQTKATDRSSWSACEPLISAWRRDFAHDRCPGQVGIDPSCQCDQPVAHLVLLGLVLLIRQTFPSVEFAMRRQHDR